VKQSVATLVKTSKSVASLFASGEGIEQENNLLRKSLLKWVVINRVK